VNFTTFMESQMAQLMRDCESLTFGGLVCCDSNDWSRVASHEHPGHVFIEVSKDNLRTYVGCDLLYWHWCRSRAACGQ